MKKIFLSILLISFSAIGFAQNVIDISANGRLVSEPTKGAILLYQPKSVTLTIDSTEYDYFAAYLVIQTSEVTNQQLEFTKKLMKYVKQNHGVLYITIQSGTPPCIPTPTQPCPKT